MEYGPLTGPCRDCGKRERVFGLLVCEKCHAADNERLAKMERGQPRGSIEAFLRSVWPDLD